MHEAESSSGDEGDVNFKAPAPKALTDLVTQDKEDESLEKMKKQLLGDAASNPNLVVFDNDPRKVIPHKMAFVVDGRPDLELDLTKLEDLKAAKHVIKEGCQYRIKFYFYVQRDIASGLKYIQKLYKGGIKVDGSSTMIGTVGPKADLQTFLTPMEEAPSGMLARSTFKVKSVFTDDDKNDYLKFEWKLEIRKEWP